MKNLLKNTNMLLTLISGVAAYIFFAFFYEDHLHYQEELQLFQFTPQYFIENIQVPAGFSSFLRQFITQFF
jgi:hypothetical protein